MLVLAVLLGAYTGFLLSALKSYPFLNNPILPVLFLLRHLVRCGGGADRHGDTPTQ